MSRLLPLLPLLAACAGEADDSTPQPSEDSAAAADSGATEPGEPFAHARFGLTFVIGADGRSFEAGALPSGEVILPTAWVAWGTERWGGDPSDRTSACVVEADLRGQQLTVTPGAEHELSFTMPDDLPATTTCDGRFDLSVFPDSDPVAGSLAPGVDWTFRWGGPPNPALSDWLDPAELALVEDFFLGAEVRSPLVSSGGSDVVYVRAYAVDEDNALKSDGGGPVPVPADALVLPDGGGAAAGAYSLTAPWLIRQ